MRFGRHIASTAVLTGAIIASVAGSPRAESAIGGKSMKPFEGVLIHAGTKHAVGYFYNEAKQCKLVLTVADEPSTDADQSFTAIRHEAAVPAGNATRYNLVQGRTLEFACHADALGMTMKEIESVVAGAAK
jgi:hypothetical protein